MKTKEPQYANKCEINIIQRDMIVIDFFQQFKEEKNSVARIIVPPKEAKKLRWVLTEAVREYETYYKRLPGREKL